MLQTSISRIQTQLTRIQPLLLWLVSAWFAYRLIVNGIRKFDPEGMWTEAFENWGYPVWFRIFIGVLEVAGGILILVPKTRFWGGLILFAVMLGALITRLIHGVSLDDALSISHFAIVFLYLMTDFESRKQLN